MFKLLVIAKLRIPLLLILLLQKVTQNAIYFSESVPSLFHSLLSQFYLLPGIISIQVHFQPSSVLKHTKTQTFTKAFIMQCYATWVSEPFWNHFRKSPAKIPTFSWRKRNFPNKQLAQFLLGVNLPLSLCSIETLWLQVLKDKCWYSKPKLLTQSSYRTKI